MHRTKGVVPAGEQCEQHGPQRGGGVDRPGKAGVHALLADAEQGVRDRVGQQGGDHQMHPESSLTREAEPHRVEDQDEHDRTESEPGESELHWREPRRLILISRNPLPQISPDLRKASP